jgi:hypothetical protein
MGITSVRDPGNNDALTLEVRRRIQQAGSQAELNVP